MYTYRIRTYVAWRHRYSDSSLLYVHTCTHAACMQKIDISIACMHVTCFNTRTHTSHAQVLLHTHHTLAPPTTYTHTLTPLTHHTSPPMTSPSFSEGRHARTPSHCNISRKPSRYICVSESVWETVCLSMCVTPHRGHHTTHHTTLHHATTHHITSRHNTAQHTTSQHSTLHHTDLACRDSFVQHLLLVSELYDIPGLYLFVAGITYASVYGFFFGLHVPK